MTGILLLDKPCGWTSHDAVAKTRRILSEKKIGHGGTLDPIATGVLPLFVGRATRAVEYFEQADKEYVAGIRLGLVTDTEDVTGEILKDTPCFVDTDEFLTVLGGYVGTWEQTPPMYSAKKIGGKKLYEYARKGLEIDRKPQVINISELELLGGGGRDFVFRVACSKGTYVRSLCAQIGASLGCGAAMTSLKRTRFADFTLDMCVTMEELMGAQVPADFLKSLDTAFLQYPAVTISSEGEKKCRCGADVPSSASSPDIYRVYNENGEFLMIAQADDEGLLRCEKSFFEI